MKKIVFATYDEVSDLNEDDSVLLGSLRKLNIDAGVSSWSNPKTKWENYDAVIIRSTWDYYKRYSEFTAWLDNLQKIQKNVWNPVSVIQWNSNKNYLAELEKSGLKTIPTVWLDKNEISLHDIMANNSWERAVIKPTVSAGSFHTYNLTKENCTAIENEIKQLTEKYDFMIQPFMNEVVNEGEWSLLFFNGVFSHAVLKKPKSGDFRVQPKYGSTVVSVTPTERIISTAKEIVRSAKEPLLYARVDGIIRNDVFYLMELELIEPMLFLGYSDLVEQRFTNAIAERL